MTYQKRYLFKQIENDLERKMVFVGGPRQVGKTTLAKHFLPPNDLGYLNWDIIEHREAILQHQFPASDLWVFDELHKYKLWRNTLKGLYDQFSTTKKILVTGSAHLDYYRYGGDSLQGRYHYLRLLPLSVAELQINKAHHFEDLLLLGGFPEPYFQASEIEAKRWSREYRARLLQEDLASLENTKDLTRLELLMLRLPQLVGSPLSINSLREDIQASHKAVSSWLNIFERLYAIFRIAPLGAPQIRAVKKEQKHYHFDWTLLDNHGARFENCVAVHLLKWIYFQQDTKARDLQLRYFRDTDGREVDFIIIENNTPIFAIECKLRSSDISKSLHYFKQRFPNCEAWQLTLDNNHDYVHANNIRVCHAYKFLMDLI